MLHTKMVEKIKTQILYVIILYPENRAVYETHTTLKTLD